MGKSKVLGLGGVFEVSYLFYYTLRDKVLSYFGLLLSRDCLWPVLWLLKGLFGLCFAGFMACLWLALWADL